MRILSYITTKVKENVRLFILLLPLSVLWGAFFLAHVMEFDENKWWAFPYFLTSFASVIFSCIIAGMVMDTDDRNNRE